MVPALVCAALEMARIHGGIVTSYGADLFGTAWIYTALRLRARRTLPWRWLASSSIVAVVTMVGGIASEFAQRANLLAGTYDPLDIVTFALALLACVVLERVLGPFVIVPRSTARVEASSESAGSPLR